ncbi:MAG: penicillin-binding protein 1C [Reichenbachiella sp.]|uniref:penicillin-binding protein 1C n=1 Tax=Reichenbachiella sp. TaxID=2184521 RepID=UPI0032671E93
MRRKLSYSLPATGLMIFCIYLLLPLGDSRLSRDYSQVILAKDSSILRVFLNHDEQWCLPPHLQQEIPQKLQVAALTFEDQYFDYHPGFNLYALCRALYLNTKHQKVVSGGSTITMQLARMIRNQPRTIINKLAEIFLAIKIEVRQSKTSILKDYLNHAPYGSNIRGYAAASYRFFGKKPEQLTWSEAATLAVLPNAPSMVFPSKNDDRLEHKRNFLLLKLLQKELIDEETYELSLLEQVPREIIPFALAAPHLTERIHAENQKDVVITTIDPVIQYETNFFVKQHASRMQQLGVKNVCALVVDNTTSSVVSYVGSQDFDDLPNLGRVDGVRAFRSSGSILKPYLYALAIDDGLILPQTLIKDVPTYFSSFSPSNASEEFSGIVPASQALIHSLNIPAVRLLNAYGVNKFYNQLESAGVSSLFRNPDDYGLPLIIGGAEVSAWDMAKLYMGLANAGNFKSISYLPSRVPESGNKLISATASQLVLDEMKELIRPGLEFYWKKYSSQKPIAWKTGTSYGHKDAWAAGCTPHWTIIVWVGNFDGSSNKALSGMRSAGPLMFNILNSLPTNPKKKWFDTGYGTTVKICSETGFYATSNCPNPEMATAPRQMKPLKTCPYHKTIFTDKNDKYAVCSHCWTRHHIESKVLIYPPDVGHYLRNKGTLLPNIPQHNPNCPTAQEHNILQIIYPLARANVFIPKDFDGGYQPLVGKVASRFPKRELFWYLDEAYLGSTIGKPTFPLGLTSGRHKLTVVDAEGNRDQVDFSVILN